MGKSQESFTLDAGHELTIQHRRKRRCNSSSGDGRVEQMSLHNDNQLVLQTFKKALMYICCFKNKGCLEKGILYSVSGLKIKYST